MDYVLKGKITKGFSYQIDESLSVEGVAADAKATGEAIREAEDRVRAEINTQASEVNTHTSAVDNPHNVTAEQVGARPNTWMPTAEEVGARPDTWTPSAQEVGASPDNWMPSASDVKARPDNWMPSASEVGARPNTWLPTPSEIGASVTFERTTTLSTSGWYSIGSVYQKDVYITELLATDKAFIDLRVPNETREPSTIETMEEEFAKVYGATVGNGAISFRATDKPTVELPIKIGVLR